jgi:hypothetical protein
MQHIQLARKAEPFFQPTAVGEDFENALRLAERADAVSMKALHAAISNCVASLKSDGMECEAALLTMKAFMRELGIKHKRSGSLELVNKEIMMDQIVRWCIADFYRE